MNIDDADKEMAAGFGAALAMTEEAVSEAADHTAALSFARNTTVYAHAPAKEDVDNLKAAYLELREVQTYVELLARLDEWAKISNAKTPHDAAAAIRNLQAAYTAAHSELERAVADLAACREVADRERERLAYVYTKQMNALVRPLMTYAEWLAAIDAAIKEQSHE